MRLDCYRLNDAAAEIVPARSDRAWMEETGSRFAYRCTPLVIANASGWELICPAPITVAWSGGAAKNDLVVASRDTTGTPPAFAVSHFGHGILTFHPGYLFRTDPDWALWCRGAPNAVKDGIVALDGLVETDWMPFSFTMNWRMTRPGIVRFEKGEAFCFLTLAPHIALEAVRPRIMPIAASPDLKAEHEAWQESRNAFNAGLAADDPSALREKWQRFYLRGTTPNGATAPDSHRAKRKLAKPTVVSVERAAVPAVAQPDGATPRNIVWIASYPKSGNTWVRVFIHNLLAAMRGEIGTAQDINRLHEHTAWETPAGPFERVMGKALGAAEPGEIAAARPAVQRLLAASRERPFLAKTHHAIVTDFGQPTVDLDATLAAVYVARNPLDVALSYAHHSGRSVDETIANMARTGLRTVMTERSAYEVIGSWSENVASWMGLPQRPVHLVRYEDLLQDPVRHFGALARFLHLSPRGEQVRAAVERSSFAELARQERSSGFNERPPTTAEPFFREGRDGQWREALSEVQVRAMLDAHAPMMQRLGYLEPTCGALDPVSLRSDDPG